jgi:hypothetical protein
VNGAVISGFTALMLTANSSANSGNSSADSGNGAWLSLSSREDSFNV